MNTALKNMMTKKKFIHFYRPKIRLSAFQWSVFDKERALSFQKRTITLSQLQTFFHPWYSDGKKQVSYRQALAKTNAFAWRVADSVQKIHNPQRTRGIRQRIQHLPKRLWALPVLVDRKTGATLLLDSNTTAAALVAQSRRHSIPLIEITTVTPERLVGDFRIVRRAVLHHQTAELRKTNSTKKERK